MANDKATMEKVFFFNEDEWKAIESVAKSYNKTAEDYLAETFKAPVQKIKIAEAVNTRAYFTDPAVLWGSATQTSIESGDNLLSKYKFVKENYPLLDGAVSLYKDHVVGKGIKAMMFKPNKKIIEEADRILSEIFTTETLEKIVDALIWAGYIPMNIVRENEDEEISRILNAVLFDPMSLEVERGDDFTVKAYYQLTDDEDNPKIELKPYEVALFSWNADTEEVLGTSMIKSIYKMGELLVNIQKSYAKGVYRFGNPVIIFVAEDWSEQDMKQFKEYLDAHKNEGIGSIILNGNVKIEQISSSSGRFEGFKDAVSNFTRFICFALAIPTYILDPSGAVDATSAYEWKRFMTRVSRIRQRIAEVIRRDILTPHLKAVFPKIKEIPYIDWIESEQIDVSQLDSLIAMMRIDRLSPEFRKGLELRVLELLRLDADPKEIERYTDYLIESMYGSEEPVATKKPKYKPNPLKTP